MFDCILRHADHSRRYLIHAVAPSGWEVRLEEDRELRRSNLYQDWHRVERALALFQREVGLLRQNGWRIAAEVG
jgi:hypothetical protein